LSGAPADPHRNPRETGETTSAKSIRVAGRAPASTLMQRLGCRSWEQAGSRNWSSLRRSLASPRSNHARNAYHLQKSTRTLEPHSKVGLRRTSAVRESFEGSWSWTASTSRIMHSLLPDSDLDHEYDAGSGILEGIRAFAVLRVRGGLQRK